MPRGYRFVIIAAWIGLAFCCGGLGAYVTALSYPDQNQYPSYRYPGDDEDAATAISINNPKAAENREPCSNPKGRDESDLCAQWKAARAAESGALWTERGFWVGLLSIVGLGITLCFNYRGLQVAAKGTSAALKSVHQAEAADERQARIGMAQIRAYISIRCAESRIAEDGSYRFRVFYVNSGQSPARRLHIHVIIMNFSMTYSAHHGVSVIGDLSSGREGDVEWAFKFDEPGQAFILGPALGRLNIVATYVDVFDVAQEDPFNFVAMFAPKGTFNIEPAFGDLAPGVR